MFGNWHLIFDIWDLIFNVWHLISNIWYFISDIFAGTYQPGWTDLPTCPPVSPSYKGSNSSCFFTELLAKKNLHGTVGQVSSEGVADPQRVGNSACCQRAGRGPALQYGCGEFFLLLFWSNFFLFYTFLAAVSDIEDDFFAIQCLDIFHWMVNKMEHKKCNNFIKCSNLWKRWNVWNMFVDEVQDKSS